MDDTALAVCQTGVRIIEPVAVCEQDPVYRTDLVFVLADCIVEVLGAGFLFSLDEEDDIAAEVLCTC